MTSNGYRSYYDLTNDTTYSLPVRASYGVSLFGQSMECPYESLIWSNECFCEYLISVHDDVNNWKHFPRYWPFVRGIHRSPVNSSHKGQWRGALMFSLNFAWINGWVNNGEADDLRRRGVHYEVTVMFVSILEEKLSCYQKVPPYCIVE